MSETRRLDPEQLPAILDALVGETAPTGETHEDDRRGKNVGAFGAVCSWVYDRIDEAERLVDRPEYSCQMVAKTVIDEACELALPVALEYGREDPMSLEVYGYVKVSGDE